MLKVLQELRKRIVVGVVGGSDFPKQKEQLGPNGMLFVFFSSRDSESARALIIGIIEVTEHILFSFGFS
jgi:hypothetical protein